MFQMIAATLFLTAIVCVYCTEFPKEYPQCKKTDSKCMISAAETIVRAAVALQGIPALGIPSLSPLAIKEMILNRGSDSPVNIKLILKNGGLAGFEDTVFSKITGFETAEQKKEIVLKTNALSFTGGYTLSGKVLILPVQGEGACNLTLVNPEASLKFKTKKIERDGKTYIQTDKLKMRFTTTRMYIHFDNLYNGQTLLGDSTNLFLNENWKDILHELQDNIADAHGLVFESILNKVFNKIPYNELFSE